MFSIKLYHNRMRQGSFFLKSRVSTGMGAMYHKCSSSLLFRPLKIREVSLTKVMYSAIQTAEHVYTEFTGCSDRSTHDVSVGQAWAHWGFFQAQFQMFAGLRHTHRLFPCLYSCVGWAGTHSSSFRCLLGCGTLVDSSTPRLKCWQGCGKL